jgi:aryl sulfotransferase
MKAHAAQAAPLGGAVWEGGGESFVHRGTNGRWRHELSPELSHRYEALAERELGEACARWLATGYR